MQIKSGAARDSSFLLEFDSTKAINFITGRCQYPEEIGPLLEEIKFLATSNSFDFRAINRNCNNVANWLAYHE